MTLSKAVPMIGLRKSLRSKLTTLSALFGSRAIVLSANEQEPALKPEDLMYVAANEQYEATPEGSKENWILLAPYGNHPNVKGLQRFDRVAANSVVQHFNSLPNIGVKMVGIPFYKGHPDIKEFESKYTDKDAYGRIKQLDAREGGLFANVKWNEKGKSLIRGEEYHGHSVAWYMKPHPSGAGWQPFALRSVGFTNDPNIEVPPITAANERMNKEQQIALAKSLGLPETATFEQIQETVTRHATFANEASNCPAELATTKKKLQDLEGAHNQVQEKVAANETTIKELTETNKTLTTQVGTLTTERDTATALVANERKAIAEPLLAQALKDGKITKAQEAEFLTVFVNEGVAKGQEKLAPLAANTALHTKSTINPAGRRANADSKVASRTEAIQLAVNEAIEKLNLKNNHEGSAYDQAFARVRKEQPALFSNAE